MRFEIDYTKINYFEMVIIIFIIIVFILFLNFIFTNLIKGINPFKKVRFTKIIKSFIKCVYISIITTLSLIGLFVLMNNGNVDTGSLICIIMFLGFVNYYYNDILDVIKIITLKIKEKFKKKNK